MARERSRPRNVFTGYRARRLSRRAALRGMAIGGAGLAGAVLVGCGDDEGGTPSATATVAGGAGGGVGATATAAATEAVATRGGVVTTGVASNNFFQLDPITGTGGDEHQFLWMVYDNLVGYDETLTPQAKRCGAVGPCGPTKPAFSRAPRGLQTGAGGLFRARSLSGLG